MVDSFFVLQLSGGEQQYWGDNDEYYFFNLYCEVVKFEWNIDLQYQVEYYGGDQQLMKLWYIFFQIKNFVVQLEGGGIVEQ